MPVAPADASVYRIVPGDSEIRILVYRDGPLASLGHNHVINSRRIDGRVVLAEKLADSLVFFNLPIAGLEVDDPALREEEGEDFATGIDAQAVAATRANMLGERVLDAGKFPQIRVVSRAISGELPALNLSVDIEIRQQVTAVELPVSVTLSGNAMRVRGELAIRQTALGLEPYSALLGGLKVRDELLVRFRLLARRTPGPSS